jgi:hypothetical protein
VGFGLKAGIVMDATLQHRAPNTYYGQWPRFFVKKIRQRFAGQCP